jgi:uncharacterized membrane protein YheB (UPF0754 family)
MLQLRVPLSKNESDVLMRCLSQLEEKNQQISSASQPEVSSSISSLASAKRKVHSQIYNDFCREEITQMVYALDSLSRECSSQLTENTPPATAEQLSNTLRTAASARSKLCRATSLD